MGHEWRDGDEPAPKPLIAYGKLLEANGWTWKLGWAQSFHPGSEIKARPGDYNADQVINLWWIDAARVDRGLVHVMYEQKIDVADGLVPLKVRPPAAYQRRRNRWLEDIPDKQMKDWIKDDESPGV